MALDLGTSQTRKDRHCVVIHSISIRTMKTAFRGYTVGDVKPDLSEGSSEGKGIFKKVLFVKKAMVLVPELRRQRQEDCHKLRPAWYT